MGHFPFYGQGRKKSTFLCDASVLDCVSRKGVWGTACGGLLWRRSCLAAPMGLALLCCALLAMTRFSRTTLSDGFGVVPWRRKASLAAVGFPRLLRSQQSGIPLSRAGLAPFDWGAGP